jgi:hypothetical protein
MQSLHDILKLQEQNEGVLESLCAFISYFGGRATERDTLAYSCHPDFSCLPVHWRWDA